MKKNYYAYFQIFISVFCGLDYLVGLPFSYADDNSRRYTNQQNVM